jgi:transposase
MRKIREVLRLRQEQGMNARDVASSCGLGCTTVLEYGYRARAANLGWPLPAELSDSELEALLFPPAPPADTDRPLPDWPRVRAELGKKGVTMTLVWQEYLQAHPSGYRYSRFVEMYREWEGKHTYSMVQHHRPGEKLFVDFSGMTMKVSNPEGGACEEMQIFVAATGYSQFVFARACRSQGLRDWLDCHALAFEFLGGVPEAVVPDNLKAGVKSPCRYEPEKNPAYADLARHYGVAVLPARSRKPRDKAKVENAVLQVERWVLAPLRNRVFFSLEELQSALTDELKTLNDKKLSDLPLSRRELFMAEERTSLKALPSSRYLYAEWKKAKVGPDYHVRFGSQAYSVPHRYCGKSVDVRLTTYRVEVSLGGEILAAHDRGLALRYISTIPEHMPESHREHAQWTPQRLLGWASEFGPCTRELVEAMLLAYVHPEHGFRPALGIVSLSKRYGAERLERACARALRARATNYASVKSILAKGLDGLEPPPQETAPVLVHANIRGADAFRGEAAN